MLWRRQLEGNNAISLPERWFPSHYLTDNWNISQCEPKLWRGRGGRNHHHTDFCSGETEKGMIAAKMLSVLRLNHGRNVTSLHITLDDARVDMNGWMRNTPAHNWISPPKHHRKEGWVKMYIGASYSEQAWTVKAGACGIQMRLSATPCTVHGGRQRKAGGAPLLTACLAVCQNFHGRLQVRAKKTGACWQWDQQIRPKWRSDRYNVQPASPPGVAFPSFMFLYGSLHAQPSLLFSSFPR